MILCNHNCCFYDWQQVMCVFLFAYLAIATFIIYRETKTEIKFERIISYILIACIVYILPVEIYIIDSNLKGQFCYVIVKVFLYLAYSLCASSIFYFVSFYLPQQYVKKKISHHIQRKTMLIDANVMELFNRLGIRNKNDNRKEVLSEMKEKFMNLNPDNKDFRDYLASFKNEVLTIIRGITVYHEYLDKNYLFALNQLEQSLFHKIVFADGNMLSVADQFRDIYVFNNRLQKENAIQKEKYKDYNERAGKKYQKEKMNREDTK